MVLKHIAQSMCLLKLYLRWNLLPHLPPLSISLVILHIFVCEMLSGQNLLLILQLIIICYQLEFHQQCYLCCHFNIYSDIPFGSYERFNDCMSISKPDQSSCRPGTMTEPVLSKVPSKEQYHPSQCHFNLPFPQKKKM